MAKFAKDLQRTTDFGEIDKNFATSIFYVEKELGAFIDENYPLMKFFSQLEELKEHYEREKREYDKESGRISWMRRR